MNYKGEKYKSLDDETMVKLVQDNQIKYFEPLFQRYIGVVFKSQREHHLKHFDTDDWIQEGRIVFYKSVMSFDFTRHVTIGALFKQSFSNRVCSLVRFNLAFKRKADQEVCSFESLPENALKAYKERPSLVHDPSKSLILKENYAEYHSELSKFEKDISSRLFNGYKPSDIAEELGCELKQITNAIGRCHRKFGGQLFDV
ncbi:sigma-70 family RNA polymerase sigma factor [Pediococcus argentinicus]|uniref:sigma-70 family RNA polymerase sigma factor n=1 Tax=Pediococcus argentinicus TaxID=480391 RepID=UPI00338D5747